MAAMASNGFCQEQACQATYQLVGLHQAVHEQKPLLEQQAAGHLLIPMTMQDLCGMPGIMVPVGAVMATPSMLCAAPQAEVAQVYNAAQSWVVPNGVLPNNLSMLPHMGVLQMTAWPGPLVESAPSAGPTQQPQPQPQPNACEQVVGRVWSLAQDQHGCRLVQQAVEEASSDDEREALALELRGCVWQAARCRHANYVLQKFITAMKPQSAQFIIDEVMHKGPSRLARHKYGCRTLQRLLEHCRVDQVHGMVEALLAEAIPLSKHIYANFVMQHLLEHGTHEQQHRLSFFLRQHSLAMGSDAHACAVVAKALSHGAGEDRMALARALLDHRGLIGQMSGTRYGNLAVRLLMQMLGGRELEEAKAQIAASLSTLRSSRHGQAMFKPEP